MPFDGINSGVQVAFAFFALGLLMIFAWGMFLGIVHFIKRILG